MGKERTASTLSVGMARSCDISAGRELGREVTIHLLASRVSFPSLGIGLSLPCLTRILHCHRKLGFLHTVWRVC